MRKLEKNLSKLVEKGVLQNSPETVVTIVDGTHGNKDGISGFSYMPYITDYGSPDPYTGEEMIKESIDIITKFKENPNACQITFQLLDIKDYHYCRYCKCDPTFPTY